MQRNAAYANNGAKPGHTNSISSGLYTKRLGPYAQRAGRDARVLIAATMQHLLAQALNALPDDQSRASQRARSDARGRALETVATALEPAPGQPMLTRHDFEQTVERLRPLWEAPPAPSPLMGENQGEGDAAAQPPPPDPLFLEGEVAAKAAGEGDPAAAQSPFILSPDQREGTSKDAASSGAETEPIAQFEALVARVRAQRARRSNKGSYHPTARGYSYGHPPLGNTNNMRTMEHSKQIGPLMRAAGPQARAVIGRAILRSTQDAMYGPTHPFIYSARWNARVRAFARDFAWRRVITVLADAHWVPPGAGATRAQRIAAAQEVEAILWPVFMGKDAVPWSRNPDRPRPDDPTSPP